MNLFTCRHGAVWSSAVALAERNQIVCAGRGHAVIQQTKTRGALFILLLFNTSALLLCRVFVC